MASIGAGIDNWAERLIRRRGLHAVQAVLFPELGPGLGTRSAARLAEGILRAPWRGRRAPAVLSACLGESNALAALSAGLPSPVLTTPARSLLVRGWESPGLLARATAARRALVAARVGGRWWAAGVAEEINRGRLGVVALAEPALADGA